MLFATWFCLLETSAQACSIGPPDTLVLDTSVEDADAPLPPAIVGIDIGRGHPGSDGVCADLGAITVTVARPDDDSDTEEDVGYHLEVLSGSPPKGFEIPEATDEPNPPLLGPELILHWNDGNDSVQEAFDFVLEIRSVDVAGNVGEPVEVPIEHGGGCSCAQPGTFGAGPLGIALAWLLRRRRQDEAGASSSAGSPSRSKSQ